MSRIPLLMATLVALTAFAGCMGQTDETTTSTSSAPAPASDFAFNVTTVDTTQDVSEPSILVDPSGTIWIAGPTGFAKTIVEKNPDPATHDSALFKSTDGGATWQNVQQIPMYGRDLCAGGGDSDIAASPDGALFLIDLNLENVPIDVSTDGGATWTFNCNSSVLPGVDRQWVAATNEYVWISVNHLALGSIVYRSDRMGLPSDGLVFGAPVQVSLGGAIVVDPATGTLYLAGSGAEVEISTDNGESFQKVQTGLSAKDVDLSNSFISIALDNSGNVFVAGAGKDGIRVSGSSDQGKTWTPAAKFQPYASGEKPESGDGEYGFAWVAAAGNGTVGFAWYGWPSGNETGAYQMAKPGYYVFAGQSSDLLQKGAEATAVYAQVSPSPITTKRLCTGINLVGFVQCDQADPSKTRGLGDFFETGMDNQGRLVIAYTDIEGKDPSHLMYAVQTGGTFGTNATA